MNILFISPLPPPYGGISRLAQSIREKGSKSDSNVKFIILDTERAKKSIKSNNDKFLKVLRGVYVLYDFFTNIIWGKIDIVHLNTSISQKGYLKDYIFALFTKLLKKKLVIQYHCDVSNYIKRRNSFGQFIAKRMICIADANVVLNKNSKLYIESFKETNCFTVGNFVSDIFIKDERKINDDKKIIVTYCGHIGTHKGSDKLIEISKYYKNIQFKLIGKVMDNFKIEEEIENIIFTGELSIDKVKKELLKSDIFIFPSLAEGFPVAVIEAMACRLPIISTKVGAVPEIVDDRLGGILIDDSKEKTLKDALEFMINKTKLELSEMGEYNRNKVIENFSYDKVIHQYIYIYSKINDRSV